MDRMASRVLPRTRTPRKRPSPGSDGIALLRLTLVCLCSAMLISAIPPLRGGFNALANTLVVAMEVSRANDANRVAVARDAIRYEISYELATVIRRTAQEEGIDPELAFRLVEVESRFDERALSPVGAMGLTQLMPRTADSLQPGISEEEIYDPQINLRLGFRYLGTLLEVYDGRVTDALHAYNRGPGTVNRIRSAGGDPSNGYADKVLGRGGHDAYRGNGFAPGAPVP